MTDTRLAVLWDMDGLLIDSEPLWTVAETELAQRLGRRWTEDIKAACIGKRLDASVPLMLAGLGITATSATVGETTTWLLTRMIELFGEGLPMMPGATQLLAALADAGVPCALVSSSYRVLVDAALSDLNQHPFSVTVAGDEVTHAKPQPEPYLLAATRLGLDPARCVVLEDSVSGARAGVAAGCPTVLVPSATVPGPAVDEGWVRVPSLQALDLSALVEVSRAGRAAP